MRNGEVRALPHFFFFDFFLFLKHGGFPMSMPIAVTGGGNANVLTETRKQENRGRRVAQERAAAVARLKTSLSGRRGADKSAAAVIARLEKLSLSFNKRLQYVVNHDSNQVTVKVIDGNTDKVIKVLPPEELQRLSKGTAEIIGALFDEKV
jgi:flagellar protein FlaG